MPTTPLLLSLYLAMGPMTVVEDGSTTLIQQAVRGGRWLGDEASLAVAASASGVAGAVLVGAQVEAVITAAHAKGSTIGESAAAAYRAGGLRALLVPHGLTMIAAREVRRRDVEAVLDPNPTSHQTKVLPRRRPPLDRRLIADVSSSSRAEFGSVCGRLSPNSRHFGAGQLATIVPLRSPHSLQVRPQWRSHIGDARKDYRPRNLVLPASYPPLCQAPRTNPLPHPR